MTGISRSRLSRAKQELEEAEAQRSGREETQGVDGGELSNRDQLKRKLIALDNEISAVAAGLETFKVHDVSGSGDGAHEKQRSHGFITDASKEGALYRAIASNRLESLKRKRVDLEEELLSARDGDEEVDRGCRGTETVEEHDCSCRAKKIRSDNGLSDSGSGFADTERDRLIRLGVLTPFHKIQGFERRVQEGGEQNRFSGNDLENRVASSIGKAAASYGAIAATRPSTKLLDYSELPPMEAPSREFRRLRRPLRLQNLEDEERKAPKRKIRRPQPGEKWRKRKDAPTDDELSDEDGQIGGISSDMEEGCEHGSITGVSGTQLEMSNGESDDNDVVLEGGLRIPRDLYEKLFDYQKTGVKWLWELHCQKTGGIIGDEMGLGKTIQVITFLASLRHSHMYTPSIVICPVTLLRQWRREVKKWCSCLRPEIMHDSAMPSSQKGVKEKRMKDQEDSECEYSDADSDVSEQKGEQPAKANRWDSMIKRIAKSKSGLLITSYEQVRMFSDKVLNVKWGYAILDEGHRIRNPDTETTLICKRLQTVHRIIMTGAPIQNKLTELWSLFDFVFPGKLGVLPVFELEFGVPIRIGGYANATPLQVSTAYKCAVVLRDLILPYLLRRMKVDVKAQLPKKTEQVLFCSLTQEQRAVYRSFISSSEVEQIFEGRRNSLYGIDVLRKICNHPDLLERDHSSAHSDYGNPKRSGKLSVLAQVLSVWHKEGHKVLIFSQTQQMLDILQNHVESMGYGYRRMDGSTGVKHRMSLVDEFNESPDVFVFILTTKVGGLGTNLVGANRVVIYDPDWNPSTDIQARERAWRIGQKREVTIYRLITRGTIEEKVYHRQIYKHFLTNKILRDPQQRRFFKSKDLRDLFSLQEDFKSGTETSALFADAEGEVSLQTQRVDHRKSGSISQSGGNLKADNMEDEGTAGPSGDEGEEEGECGNGDETHILQDLFQANGIHSVMDHDAIVSVMDKEKMKVDYEASKVAQRAAEALLQSRMLRCNDSIAVPTWTGRSGTAGAPVALRRRFGSTVSSRLQASPSAPTTVAAGSSAGRAPTSSALLARLRNNQSIGMGTAEEFRGTSSDTTTLTSGRTGANAARSNRIIPAPPEVLARQLCTFLQQNGGNATSASVVEHFKERLPSQDVAMFRQLLKNVATMKKEEGESRWYLKPEFMEV